MDEKANKENKNYQIGNKIIPSTNISGIISLGDDYIIYINTQGLLSWEITNIPEWLLPSVIEATRLNGIIIARLSRKYLRSANNLLGRALLNSILVGEKNSTSEQFEDVRNFLDEKKDEYINIVHMGTDFTIYKNSKDEIQYWHTNVPEQLYNFMKEFVTYRSLANNSLPHKHKLLASNLLAGALNSAFRKPSSDDSSEILRDAKDFITQQINSSFRLRYFSALIIISIISITLLLLINQIFPDNSLYFWGAICGTTGSLLSLLHRMPKIKLNPFLSVGSLIIEGCVRLLIGCIFGVFIILASKSNIALGFLKNNMLSLLVFSIISGFSERFVPELIQSITNNSLNKIKANN